MARSRTVPSVAWKFTETRDDRIRSRGRFTREEILPEWFRIVEMDGREILRSVDDAPRETDRCKSVSTPRIYSPRNALPARNARVVQRVGVTVEFKVTYETEACYVPCVRRITSYATDVFRDTANGTRETERATRPTPGSRLPRISKRPERTSRPTRNSRAERNRGFRRSRVLERAK